MDRSSKFTLYKRIFEYMKIPLTILRDENIMDQNEVYLIRNILKLIEIGDSSITAAARNGRIKKIHYVDTQVNKVYVPLLFLPIYAKETKTVVYGE